MGDWWMADYFLLRSDSMLSWYLDLPGSLPDSGRRGLSLPLSNSSPLIGLLGQLVLCHAHNQLLKVLDWSDLESS